LNHLAIAATIIHYINEVIVDTNAIGMAGYVFENHAKHWSELKGFSLGLQFNPRKQITDANFASLHTNIGDKPELTSAGAAAYVVKLNAARDLLQTAYAFDTANVAGW